MVGLNQNPLRPEKKTESAADIASGIVKEDSKFMQAAATKGRQIGNSRGLLNSSMAAGAGMNAAMEYAAPLAQQEASQNFQRNRATEDFDRENVIREDVQAFERGMREDEQEFQMNDREDRQSFEAQQQDDKQAFDKDSQIRSINANAQAQASDFNFRADESERARKQELKTLDIKIKDSNRSNAQTMLSNAQNAYSTTINAINDNKDLSSSERKSQISAAKSFLKAQSDMVKQLFNVPITWR